MELGSKAHRVGGGGWGGGQSEVAPRFGDSFIIHDSNLDRGEGEALREALNEGEGNRESKEMR